MSFASDSSFPERRQDDEPMPSVSGRSRGVRYTCETCRWTSRGAYFAKFHAYHTSHVVVKASAVRFYPEGRRR